MTTFYRASKLPLARERLLELIDIESNAVVRKGLGACTDKYERDWTPRLEGDFARVSYGHDLENIWLLVDACNAAGISNHPVPGSLSARSSTTRCGTATTRKEVASTTVVRFNKPADQRSKTWWVEAEAIVSALYMHRLTGDAKVSCGILRRAMTSIDSTRPIGKTAEWHATITPRRQGLWETKRRSGRRATTTVARA